MKHDDRMLNERREKAAHDVLRVLFIGNSATYVHDLPQTLFRLADQAGYHIEVTSVVKGGYMLSQHADPDTEHGRKVLREIRRGYDVVFLQDNGNCITSQSKREACRAACSVLHGEIVASGAQTFLYVRPPYGIDLAEYGPFAQCITLDRLFGEIARELGAVCAHVNRAFAEAMTNLTFDLWGPDHAHIGEHGAYLAVCVFFATLFRTSSSTLGANGLPPEDACALQKVADRIVLDGVLPW